MQNQTRTQRPVDGMEYVESIPQEKVTSRVRPASMAFIAPLICAVHCLAAPFLVLFLPGFAIGARAEQWLLVGSTVLAGWFLAQGWRVHRRLWVPLVGGAGVLLWTLSLARVVDVVPEPVTTVLGAVLLAGALFVSVRMQPDGLQGCACSTCAGRPPS